MGILVFIITYILSVAINYRWLQLAHYHPKGNYKMIAPLPSDVFFTFFPIINYFGAIYCIFTPWKDSKYRKDNSIFKPRKPFK